MPHWSICIDTGGTFTDGIGVAPDGEERRVKILSTAALRGTLVRRLGPASFEVSGAWDAPTGLLAGFRFRVLGAEHDALRVEAYDRASGALELDGPLPLDLLQRKIERWIAAQTAASPPG